MPHGHYHRHTGVFTSPMDSRGSGARFGEDVGCRSDVTGETPWLTSTRIVVGAELSIPPSSPATVGVRVPKSVQEGDDGTAEGRTGGRADRRTDCRHLES